MRVVELSLKLDAVTGAGVESKIKILSDNRSAGHYYELSDRFEAGLVLTGTEVKSARDGKIQLKEAFAEVSGNEAWLVNAHIGQYSHGNIMNHEPTRRRKLLLHRQEIDKLLGKTREKGLTLVPTKLYLKNGRIKLELAVGKGKKLHDKRESEREREMDAEARAGMRRKAKQ
ncbi:MAG: SsrA-binding protein SmpB [Bryobacteraceae bacterium]